MSENNARALIQGECIRLMKQFDPSGHNAKYWEELLVAMSNADFERFMEGMISGTNPLYGLDPNFFDTKITTENNIKVARDLGYELYQRVWVTDPVTGREFLTPRKHLVYPMVVCRQVQTLDHKISVPKDNSKMDNLTGQPAGNSRAAQCSGPELMVLKSKGYNSTLVEMLKFRGGDTPSMRTMDNTIIKEGSVSMNTVPGAKERSNKSIRTLSILLNGMMFSNTFAGAG